MSAELERLRRQQEANAIEIQRMKMRQNSEQARRQSPEEEVIEEQVDPRYIQQQQPQYNTVTPEQIAIHAANLAAERVQKNISAYTEAGDKVKMRMNRLIQEYPALQDENSQMVIRARDEYQRIAAENPSLDEATRYELSVKSAASALGAVPVNASAEHYAMQDFVMPSNSDQNPSRGNSRGGKSRLTQNIIANAKIMGINVDPRTPEGKQNLKELDEYSARFNADADESMYKYR